MDPTTRFRLMAAAAVAVAGTGLMAAYALLQPSRSGPEPRLPVIRVLEPAGRFTDPPAVFRWEPVTGAVLYRLTVADSDTFWPLAVRETEGTSFSFTDRERRAWSARRRFSWTVEALTGRGARPFARGEGFFVMDPGT